MKKIAFVLLTLILTSCNQDECECLEENFQESTFLTINNDTREIINEGTDPDLRITKSSSNTGQPDFFNIESVYHLFELRISDPNQSLTANFGNYNVERYLTLRFAFPIDFELGTYKTFGRSNQPTSTHVSGSISIGDDFWGFTSEDYSVKISETDNEYLIEFSDVDFESVSSPTRTATVSGRLEINK